MDSEKSRTSQKPGGEGDGGLHVDELLGGFLIAHQDGTTNTPNPCQLTASNHESSASVGKVAHESGDRSHRTLLHIVTLQRGKL